MSYDLFFYKHRTSKLTSVDIAEYLTKNLVTANENKNQWFFENDNTEVYFSFETFEPEEFLVDEELNKKLESFENINFSFNLNFIRPAFFGLEAFEFVVRFIKDLGLYVFNPQGEINGLEIPTKESLFENWNETNFSASIENFNENSIYFPIEKSNEIWEYNFNRENYQLALGNEYFVSKIFLFKRRHDNQPVTLSMWAKHIPNVLPKTDYYFLGREYKRLGKKVKDSILLSNADFERYFSDYFEDYSIKNSMIIHPETAASIKKLYNSIQSDIEFKKYLERVEMDGIVNAKPNE